jgi:hypothetical protein
VHEPHIEPALYVLATKLMALRPFGTLSIKQILLGMWEAKGSTSRAADYL